MRLFSRPTNQSTTDPNPPSEVVPDDLVRLGFRLVVRQPHHAVIRRSRDRKPVGVQTIDRPLYLLVSTGYGVATGVTMDEAIQDARSIASFCAYVNTKRAEQAQ